MSALSQAIRNRRWRQARLLIEAGFDINRRSPTEKRTALMEVCFLDDEDKALGLAKKLLQSGAELGFQDAQGLTALSYACILKRRKLVSLFLQAVDYNLNAIDRDGNTALFHSITVGDLSIVETIVQKLKHYDLSVDTQNHKGETPLIHALKIGNIQCADCLIQKGKASVEICDLEQFKSAKQWKKELQRKGKRIISALHSAEGKKGDEQKKIKRKTRKTVSAKPTTVCTLPTIKDNTDTKTVRPFTAPGLLPVSDFFTPCSPVQEELLHLYGIYNQQRTSSYRRGYKFAPKPIKKIAPLEEEIVDKESLNRGETPQEQGKARMSFAQVNELSSKIKGLQRSARNRKSTASPASSDGRAISGKKSASFTKLLGKGESKEFTVPETASSFPNESN